MSTIRLQNKSLALKTDAVALWQGSDSTTPSREAAVAVTRLMTLLRRPVLLQAVPLVGTLAPVVDVSDFSNLSRSLLLWRPLTPFLCRILVDPITNYMDYSYDS